ncbi:thiamine pyrophosphate-dependent dehydrogenase E1 component subunit alpha [Halanaerobium hydrogeniformans]|uniref:Pyruvate dehydrogenase (Acetyl-transferring) n=1 Tax=Halanaerobium hydrogeniformans TaxID=656519 RepID=E4RNW3_HALHG|nr:thiamine pyrophosphate-dependent dehydrogenase E1 component subunit alpha [Halanaerobium hydrogeniformans]ADQ13653.1 Pyruvate dehydrogenase (acetyl-transferring) [Halanaerobium hydrogeniformans]
MEKSKETLLDMYEKMYKIRLFEDNAVKLFNQGLVRGPMHVYTGEEAVAVGACSNLNDDDLITSTHRGHGHCIAKGGRVDKMAAELLAKGTGYCKGKGGSMHIADPDIGILGANGIVGAGLPIATGSALSSKMRGTDQVTICFFGDGATNEGAFHEALNMAAIWDLPVVFVCENNLYGLTGPADEMVSVKDVASRAASYDIPGVVVDGNDVLDVYETVGEAIKRAKNGGGPSLIEAKTYRIKGHFVGDPQVYRDDEEVEKWKKRCPIKKHRNYLIETVGVASEELAEIEAKVKKEIKEAVKFAKESPDPEIEVVFEDVFSK